MERDDLGEPRLVALVTKHTPTRLQHLSSSTQNAMQRYCNAKQTIIQLAPNAAWCQMNTNVTCHDTHQYYDIKHIAVDWAQLWMTGN